ncbi:MAG: ferric reductase-like transmembrane domain-containing protein, partial [Sulfitobacter sp.]
QTVLIWSVLAALILVPLMIAGRSPYLQYRSAFYIIAGFAGILCLGLFLMQPLVAANYLPGLDRQTGRKWHRWIGGVIVACLVLHIGGLFLTSRPDTIDALLLRSPTPFSVFGVIALWGVVLTVLLVVLRRRWLRRFSYWYALHNALASVVVISTVIHAVQIEGTMGAVSKMVLCTAVLIATAVAVFDLRIVRPRKRRKAPPRVAEPH